jgi:hypothetical protein
MTCRVAGGVVPGDATLQGPKPVGGLADSKTKAQRPQGEPLAPRTSPPRRARDLADSGAGPRSRPLQVLAWAVILGHMSEVTRVLEAIESGDPHAAGQPGLTTF